MAEVYQKMVRKVLSVSEVSEALDDEYLARGILHSPPDYICDMLQYLEREKLEGWSKVTNKKQQVDVPRSYLSMWLNGEDLEVFSAMTAHASGTDRVLSVSLEPIARQRNVFDRLQTTMQKTKSEQVASHDLHGFRNAFAYLDLDATNISTDCQVYSESDDSDDGDDDLPIECFVLDNDAAADSNIDTSRNLNDLAFTTVFAFCEKYVTGLPVVQNNNRSLRHLKESTDYWNMNLQERTELYAHWQDRILKTRSATYDKLFNELREDHATVLTEMEDYRDSVSSNETKH